jgi:hypothetical protein
MSSDSNLGTIDVKLLLEDGLSRSAGLAYRSRQRVQAERVAGKA